VGVVDKLKAHLRTEHDRAEHKFSGTQLSAKLDRKSNSSTLSILTAAALAIPGTSIPELALAQSALEGPIFRAQYDYYRDYQKNDERITVKTPSFWLFTPLDSSTTLQAGYVIDSVSGASPWYLSTVSGATGIGINDNRRAGDLKISHEFDSFSLGVGGSYSTEQDYKSSAGLLEATFWTPDKNTTLTSGLAATFDSIQSSNDETLDERRRTWAYSLGVSQVLTPQSFLQTNLTYGSADGYFSDPYKFFDKRPHSRESWAWLTRYRYLLRSLGAALHLDYRFAWDSWSLRSHMLEAGWYQPILDSWTIRPSIRYYTQGEASFFYDSFPPIDDTYFYSADQRLSAFGSLTLGIKLIKDFGDGWSCDIGYAAMQQRAALALGSATANNLESLYARWWSVGMTKKF